MFGMVLKNILPMGGIKRSVKTGIRQTSRGFYGLAVHILGLNVW